MEKKECWKYNDEITLIKDIFFDISVMEILGCSRKISVIYLGHKRNTWGR